MSFESTIEPVYKDQYWKDNNLVFEYRLSLYAGSFMQKIINLETKSMMNVDRELISYAKVYFVQI